MSDFGALSPDSRRRVTLAVGSPGAITFGLSAVRNVGEGLVDLLIAEREANGPFSRLPRLRASGCPNPCSTSERSSR
jgi:DNA polymerase III alpha subunit